MFNIGDYLVFRRDVCKVTQIKEKHYNDTDYYVLIQVDDSSLKREFPVNSDQIRPLVVKAKIKELIKEIPKISKVEVLNDKFIEAEYKKLIKSGKHEDLMKIIKTSYLRNKDRLDNDKKTSAVDENYLKQAEKHLYTEISVVLGISYDDVKKMIIDVLTKPI